MSDINKKIAELCVACQDIAGQSAADWKARAEKAEKESEALKERLSKSSARNFDMRDRLEQMQAKQRMSNYIDAVDLVCLECGYSGEDGKNCVDCAVRKTIDAQESAKRKSGEE